MPGSSLGRREDEQQWYSLGDWMSSFSLPVKGSKGSGGISNAANRNRQDQQLKKGVYWSEQTHTEKKTFSQGRRAEGNLRKPKKPSLKLTHELHLCWAWCGISAQEYVLYDQIPSIGTRVTLEMSHFSCWTLKILKVLKSFPALI